MGVIPNLDRKLDRWLFDFYYPTRVKKFCNDNPIICNNGFHEVKDLFKEDIKKLKDIFR